MAYPIPNAVSTRLITAINPSIVNIWTTSFPGEDQALLPVLQLQSGGIAITIEYSERGLAARTGKGRQELTDRRILEKFEIERRYWDRCGIPWKIITEEQINSVKAKNIMWLKAGRPEKEWFTDECLMRECEEIFEELYSHEKIPFEEILDFIEGYAGSGLAVFRALVLSGRIGIDISGPFCFRDPRRV